MEKSHLPCPHDDCSSSDAFSYNEEKKVGYCHSCGRGWKGEREVTTPIMSSRSYSSKPLLTPVFRGDRSISTATMETYGVETFVDQDGVAREHHYPYPRGKKIRVLPKEGFRTADGFSSDQLFGIDKFNSGSSKFVTITEGEIDAMSAYQMLGSKYPVVSLPSATPSQKLFAENKEWLDSFDKIYLSFDSDGKSDHVAQKLFNMFPNKVYRVPHDKYKDANEFLMDGAAKEYHNAWWNAKKYTPDNVYNTPEEFLEIYNNDEDSSYILTGIRQFDDMANGLMQGHFTIFQAPEGIGKTEFMRYLEYNLLDKYPEIPFAICHMEETKKRSILGLVSYDLDVNVTRKDLIDAMGMSDQVEESIYKLTERENLYQFTMGVEDDPISILDKIRYFSEACGCKYIFFEPIQDLGYSRQDDSSLEQWLSQLSTKLARLAAELNIGIVSIAHENDDGNIRDCRMIGKRASVVVQLRRNKLSDDAEEKNTTRLMMLKNRPTGNTGPCGELKFDPNRFKLYDKENDFDF